MTEEDPLSRIPITSTLMFTRQQLADALSCAPDSPWGDDACQRFINKLGLMDRAEATEEIIDVVITYGLKGISESWSPSDVKLAARSVVNRIWPEKR